jgi:hypothetical protein
LLTETVRGNGVSFGGVRTFHDAGYLNVTFGYGVAFGPRDASSIAENLNRGDVNVLNELF